MGSHIFTDLIVWIRDGMRPLGYSTSMNKTSDERGTDINDFDNPIRH